MNHCAGWDFVTSGMSDDTKIAAIVSWSGSITAIVRTLIRCATLVAIFYYLTQMVEALAGKITIADFAINLWANLKLQYIVPYTFGGGGIVYGIYQRRLRKKRVKELSSYARTLERKIDPNRASSDILDDGTTPPDQQNL